jgi:biopolymer transport protein ExbD
MAANVGGGSKKRIVSINVTPMVDVMLVLLVIMMVSAKYIVAHSFQIELPRVASRGESVSSTVELVITEAGDYIAGERTLSGDEQLTAFLNDARSHGGDVNLVLRADRQARHGAVVHVMDVARELGILRFAINVQRDH